MEIIQAGVSHQTTPIEIREQLALADIPTVLQALCREDDHDAAPILEGVILSTCNRLEVYAVARQAEGARQTILQCLGQACEIPQEVLRAHLRFSQGKDAVSHLCEVACGLDAMILGEPQIQGQVAEAYELAQGQGVVGPVLSALFQTALRAGKRVRSETALARYATSISHVAVELALQIFDDLSTKSVLLIGAGEMAELAAKNLVDNGVGTLLIVNRSAARAAGLAERFDGEVFSWDDLLPALVRSDIVISSTAAPYPVLRRDMVASAMRLRSNRPLFLIDIAVPRDVEPGVGQLANVFLYDIDDLQQVIEANLEQRRREVPHAQTIIREEVSQFLAWLRAREVVPTLVELRRHMESLRAAETEWALRKLGGLSEQERKVVLMLSQRLVNKFLHQPMTRLKQHANGRDAYRYTEVLRDLFGLSDEICEAERHAHG